MIIDEVSDDIGEKISNFIELIPIDTSIMRMSFSGECPRMLDLLMSGKPREISESSHLRMERGKFLHNMWQDILKQALGDDFDEMEHETIRELLYEGEKFCVPGHYDGYIKSIDAIYEIKNVSEYSFQKIVSTNRPFPQHIAQANYYCHGRGASSVIIHYFNVNSCESKRFFVPYSKELGEATDLMWINRVRNRRENVIEKRPYNNIEEMPCVFCQFKGDCYKDLKEEVSKYKGRAERVDYDNKYHEKMIFYVEARKNRLHWEKQEAALKKDVIDILHAMKVREFRLENFDTTTQFSLSVGKNKNNLLKYKEIEHESDRKDS